MYYISDKRFSEIFEEVFIGEIEECVGLSGCWQKLKRTIKNQLTY